MEEALVRIAAIAEKESETTPAGAVVDQKVVVEQLSYG